MKTVEMYYANLTNIDLAIINKGGYPVGDSFNLHLELKGQEDPVENVLIDFSSAKKQIKAWIDDHEGNGFDHKCWVLMHPEMRYIVDHHLPQIHSNTDEGTVDSKPDTKNKRTRITTEYTTIEASTNCFRFISAPDTLKFGSPSGIPEIIACAEVEIAAYLQNKFAVAGQDIQVVARLTNNFSYPEMANKEFEGITFRYTHGLKNSTSFGCQNIVHGHISYITAKLKDGTEFSDNHYRLLDEISDRINLSTFVYESNMVGEVQTGFNHPESDYMGDVIVLEYNCPRGAMYQEIRADNCIVMNEESTVENIAQWVVREYGARLSVAGFEKIYVSEGLEKGGVGIVR